jgi:hypothetical protein
MRRKEKTVGEKRWHEKAAAGLSQRRLSLRGDRQTVGSLRDTIRLTLRYERSPA